MRLDGLSPGARGSGQHAINLLGKILKRDCAGDRDRWLFLGRSTDRPYQNKAGGAMKSPPVRLLAILENRFEILHSSKHLANAA